MEKGRKVMEKLVETKSELDEIKKQYKEIDNVLDKIEEKRNPQKPQDQRVPEASASAMAVSEHGGMGKNTAEAATNTLTKPDDVKSKPECKMDFETTGENKTEASSSQTDKRVKTGSTDDEGSKTKGILKKLDTGTAQSYGFKERLDLTLEQVMYGSRLRRTAVEMHQDNRLCWKFGLHSNVGVVYESTRSWPTENTAAGGEDATTPRAKISQQTWQEPKQKKVTIIETDENERGKVARKQTTQVQIPKRMPDPVGGHSAKTLRDLVSLSGDLTKVQKDDILKMMRDANSGLDKEQMSTFTEKFMTEFFGSSKTIKIADFLNLSREQYIERLMRMTETDLNENERHELYDSLVENLPFDEDGKIDLLKCIDMARPFMTKENGASTKGHFERDGENAASGEAEGKGNKSSDLHKQNAPDRRLPEMTSVAGSHNVKEEPFDDSQEIRVDIEIDDWIQSANAEIQKGRLAQDIRERGMDTVICLDVSSSMRGVAWKQALDFIKNFIEGIQNSTLMDDVYEHVALATFGSETCVQQHLTCDYLEILRKLDRLKPSGPTPMYAGLQMVHAALIGAGSIFVSNGYKIHPRVFLITDGKSTPTGMIAGPDEYASKHTFEDEIHVLLLVKELTEKFHVTVNPVPVGEFNLNILEKIAEFSKGKIVSPEAWRMHTRTFKNYLAASKLGGAVSSHLASQISREVFEFVNPGASEEDKDQMLEFLRTHERNDESDEEESKPPLGSRVRRQLPTDTHELGTVTKHMNDGYIGVTWDEPNQSGAVREKVPYSSDMKSVRQVDEPRILHGDLIAEGCRVRRGRDWHYGDQDGGVGSLGNVYRVNPDGVVKVRWDNGNKNSYLFGASGKFDLEIIEQNEQPKKRKKQDTKSAGYSLPSDDESIEEKRVKEMNEKNKSIYSFIDEKLEVEGAAGGVVDSRQAMHMVTDKNKRNVNEVDKFASKTEASIYDDVSSIKREIQKGTASQDSKINELNRRNTGTTSYSKIEKENDRADTSLNTKAEENGAKPKAEENGAKPKAEENGAKPKAEENGAKPKIVGMKTSATHEGQKSRWMWQNGGTWNEYPLHICEKIETDYNRNPKGTTVIRLDNVLYRVVFPKMQQINTETKEKYTVQRKTCT